MTNKITKSLVPDCLSIDFCNITEDKIEEKFQSIAEELIKKFVIIKNNADPLKRIKYRFMELEFYYCSPNHFDIITYPRKANAGDWFFHSSGVDICFQSTVHLNDETGRVVDKPFFDKQANEEQASYGFGGILIRALQKETNDTKTFITGPLKCCYELFDRFSAFDDPQNFPRIEKLDSNNEITCSSCGRYFNFSTNLETKLKNILHDHWEDEYEMLNDLNKKEAYETFEKFLKRKYCFFDENAFQDFNIYRKNHTSCKAYNADPSKYINKERLNNK